MNNYKDFISWESSSKDTVDFKMIYVDMTNNLESGLLLSQIIFWYLPDSNGNSRLRVEKRGHFWIAKTQNEWYKEIRLSRKKLESAINNLINLGLIEKAVFKFDGTPIRHFRLIKENFIKSWQSNIENNRDYSDKKQTSLDLSKLNNSFCSNDVTEFVQFGQNINKDHYREHTRDNTTDDDDEYVITRFGNYEGIVKIFKHYNTDGVSLTPIQDLFLNKLLEYKISNDVGFNFLLEIANINHLELGNLNRFSEKALSDTFFKTINRARAKKLYNPPLWFARTLSNENFNDDQQMIEQRAIEKTNKKYGIK